MERPDVKPRDWIYVGGVSAVVCEIYKDPWERHEVEVVFLDERNRAINEDAYWTGDKWEFASETVSGGYADGYSRLSEFVSVLRAGKFRR